MSGFWPPGSSRRLYADGERMLLVTSHPDLSHAETIRLDGFSIGALEYHQDVQVYGFGLDESVPMVTGQRLQFEIQSQGPITYQHVAAGLDPVADFLPARALTIEQLLAIVHRKMRDRGEDLGAALARLPAA